MRLSSTPPLSTTYRKDTMEVTTTKAITTHDISGVTDRQLILMAVGAARAQSAGDANYTLYLTLKNAVKRAGLQGEYDKEYRDARFSPPKCDNPF